MARKTTVVRTAKESAKTRVGTSVLILRGVIGLALLGGLLVLSQPGVLSSMADTVKDSLAGGANTHGGVTRGDAELADLFTPEVLYWQDDIKRWGSERNMNPNLIATIIQIESCGDSQVTSGAGAQGLFQVMPLHFEDDENQLNPEMNAFRGLNHLSDCLRRSGYDVGISFACYNGGASVIGRPQSEWAQESRNYYAWGTGIYDDASHGKDRSDTLDQWLAAGGSRLCQRAQVTQEFYLP